MMPCNIGFRVISARIRVLARHGRRVIAVVRSPRSRPGRGPNPTKASFNANGKDTGFLILALMGFRVQGSGFKKRTKGT
jgi:hypothetical protein